MAIIISFWELIVLLVCSIMQTITIIVGGVAKILYAIVDIMHDAHDWTLGLAIPKKEEEQKVHIDIPL